jgi:hypothetical protein
LTKRPRTVLAAYALSGFASLGYQVVWLRVFADRFGSTSLTFLLVIVGFIAGLGLGALAARPVERLVSRVAGTTDRLRVYGLLELLVSAAVLVTPLLAVLPPAFFGAFPYVPGDGVFEPTALSRLAQGVVAVACLLPATFLMGATYPLLCDASREDGRYPALLYACNTLGAGAGVLACEFWLLPALGHWGVLGLLLGANLLIGLGLARTAPRPPAPCCWPRRSVGCWWVRSRAMPSGGCGFSACTRAPRWRSLPSGPCWASFSPVPPCARCPG